MLKSHVVRGPAQLTCCHIATRPVIRPIAEVGRSLQQRQTLGSRFCHSRSRGSLTCCSAAPAAMATTSISGRLAELKEQGR